MNTHLLQKVEEKISELELRRQQLQPRKSGGAKLAAAATSDEAESSDDCLKKLITMREELKARIEKRVQDDRAQLKECIAKYRELMIKKIEEAKAKWSSVGKIDEIVEKWRQRRQEACQKALDQVNSSGTERPILKLILERCVAPTP